MGFTSVLPQRKHRLPIGFSLHLFFPVTAVEVTIMEEDMEGCHLLCTLHKASRPYSHHEVKLSSSQKHPGPSLLPGAPFLFISTSHLIFRKNY